MSDKHNEGNPLNESPEDGKNDPEKDSLRQRFPFTFFKKVHVSLMGRLGKGTNNDESNEVIGNKVSEDETPVGLKEVPPDSIQKSKDARRFLGKACLTMAGLLIVFVLAPVAWRRWIHKQTIERSETIDPLVDRTINDPYILRINVPSAFFLTLGLLFLGVSLLKSKKSTDEPPRDIKQYNQELVNGSTFGIIKGAVRIYLVFLLGIALFNYVTRDLSGGEAELPLVLVVSLNAILIFYGLKPSDVLPANLVYEGEMDAPTTKTLLTNFPQVNEFIEKFEGEFRTYRKKISDFLKAKKGDVNNIFSDINNQINGIAETSTFVVNSIQQQIQSIRDDLQTKQREVMAYITNANQAIRSVEGPKNTESPYDKIAFVMFSLILSLFLFNTGVDNSELPVQLLFASTAAVFAMVAGQMTSKNLLFGEKGNNTLNEWIKKPFVTMFTEVNQDIEQSISSINATINKKNLIEGLNITVSDSYKKKLLDSTKKLEGLDLPDPYKTKVLEFIKKFEDLNITDPDSYKKKLLEFTKGLDITDQDTYKKKLLDITKKLESLDIIDSYKTEVLKFTKTLEDLIVAKIGEVEGMMGIIITKFNNVLNNFWNSSPFDVMKAEKSASITIIILTILFVLAPASIVLPSLNFAILYYFASKKET